jgi:hypothetical protein
MEQFGRHFAIRKVAPSKMDPNFQHPLIHIYLLKRRKQPLEAGAAVEAGGEAEEVGPAGAQATEPAAEAQREAADAGGPVARLEQSLAVPSGAAGSEAEGGAATESGGAEGPGGSEVAVNPRKPQIYEQQFETRREASMLARTLKDVEL